MCLGAFVTKVLAYVYHVISTTVSERTKGVGDINWRTPKFFTSLYCLDRTVLSPTRASHWDSDEDECKGAEPLAETQLGDEPRKGAAMEHGISVHSTTAFEMSLCAIEGRFG